MDFPGYPAFTGTEPCTTTQPDRFFPQSANQNGDRSAVESLCLDCPLMWECREWGIKHELHGTWGGMTSRERRKYRRDNRVVIQIPPAPSLLNLWPVSPEAMAERARKLEEAAAS